MAHCKAAAATASRAGGVTEGEVVGDADSSSDSEGEPPTFDASDFEVIRAGSIISPALMKLMMHFIDTVPGRSVSQRVLTAQFNGYVRRSGLEHILPPLSRQHTRRIVDTYIPRHFGVHFDLRSLMKSPCKMAARCCDMWWAYAEGVQAVPQSEHGHLHKGVLDEDTTVWMDEAPLRIAQCREKTITRKGRTAVAEGLHNYKKCTLLMAVSKSGILKMEVVEGTASQQDYIDFMVGRWDRVEKRRTGGLLQEMEGNGYCYLIQDNLGRSNAKVPIAYHFAPIVRMGFASIGVSVEHVPPGGCVMNPIECINFIIQQFVRAWAPDDRDIGAMLGPTTMLEMTAAAAAAFKYYISDARGKKSLSRCLARAMDARALGRDAVALLLGHSVGVKVRMLRDARQR